MPLSDNLLYRHMTYIDISIAEMKAINIMAQSHERIFSMYNSMIWQFSKYDLFLPYSWRCERSYYL